MDAVRDDGDQTLRASPIMFGLCSDVLWSEMYGEDAFEVVGGTKERLEGGHVQDSDHSHVSPQNKFVSNATHSPSISPLPNDSH